MTEDGEVDVNDSFEEMFAKSKNPLGPIIPLSDKEKEKLILNKISNKNDGNGNGRLSKKDREEDRSREEYNAKILAEEKERIEKERKEREEKLAKQKEEELKAAAPPDVPEYIQRDGEAPDSLKDIDWQKELDKLNPAKEVAKEEKQPLQNVSTQKEETTTTTSTSTGQKEEEAEIPEDQKELITVAPGYKHDPKTNKTIITMLAKDKIHEVATYQGSPHAKIVIEDIKSYIKVIGKGKYKVDSDKLKVLVNYILTDFGKKVTKPTSKAKKTFSLEDAENYNITEKDFEKYVVPLEAIGTEPINIQGLIEVFKEGLYIAEDATITIPTAFAVANSAPNDPRALALVGPSGSGKTEVISSIGEQENQYAYPMGRMTVATLISGKADNLDVMPILKGRMITIKEFGVILAMKPDDVIQIFSQFLEVLDGYAHREWGCNVKKNYTGVHSSILIASTNEIERHHVVAARLGQRMILFRPVGDPVKAREKAVEVANKEPAMRAKRHDAMLRFLNQILSSQKDRIANLSHAVPAEMKDRIGKLCDFLAMARAIVPHDWHGNVSGFPEPEYPTRLTKTLCDIVDAHSILFNRTPTEEDFQVAVRIVRDNIPTNRLPILLYLNRFHSAVPTDAIAADVNVNTKMVYGALEDLRAIGLVDKYSPANTKSKSWCLSEHKAVRETLAMISTLKMNTNALHLKKINGKEFLKDEDMSDEFKNMCKQVPA